MNCYISRHGWFFLIAFTKTSFGINACDTQNIRPIVKRSRFSTCTIALTFFALILLTSTHVSAKKKPGESWCYHPELLRPFWEGDTVEGESILFLKDPKTGQAKGSLLFPALEVLAVRNSSGTITYQRGVDYSWKPGSRELILPANSRIVSRTSAQMRRPANSQKHRLTHRDGNGEIFFGGQLEYHDLQTVITYKHALGLWKTSVPHFDEKALPTVIGKLRTGKPVSIVVLGDSISSGCNASGWAHGKPFQPAYPGLIQQHLEASYQSKVTLTNLSISGKSTPWALTMVDQVVASKPDLVILAFGMNDSAGRSTKEYQANTKLMMQKVREQLPACEFILVATMLGNADWTTLHHERFPEYRDALAELCEPGIALADVTSIWSGLLKHKKFIDLTGNGVNHPNDFGHRVYAQVITALLVEPEK